CFGMRKVNAHGHGIAPQGVWCTPTTRLAMPLKTASWRAGAGTRGSPDPRPDELLPRELRFPLAARHRDSAQVAAGPLAEPAHHSADGCRKCSGSPRADDAP